MRGHLGSGVAIGAVVAVAATFLVAVPAGAATRLQEASDCVPSVAAVDAAMAMAETCGAAVEVESERTPWNTLYAQPDGLLRLESSIGAVRTDVSGEWAPIDTELLASASGLEVASPVTPMVFSDGRPGIPLARISRDGHELTFDAPFTLPEPIVNEATLTYVGVLPGVDLVVAVNDDGTGFSEVLRVATPEAAANPALAEIAFPVETSSGLRLEQSGGGFTAVDGAGEVVFGAPNPVMWDSAADSVVGPAPLETSLVGSPTGGEGLADPRVAQPVEGDEVAEMDVQLRDGAVVLTPDQEMMTDPSTAWPVYLDPTIVGSRSYWVSVRNDGYTDSNYSGDQGVGHCGTTGSPMYCSSVFTRRAAWQFSGLQAVGNAEPDEVQSAVLSVYGTHSYSCTAYPVEAWWTGSIGPSTSWSSLNWLRLEQSQSLAHKAACGNQRWIEFNVTEASRETARANADQLTVGLKAADEGSSTGWKRYQFDAQLVVTYNRRPYQPTNVRTTDPDSPCVIGAGRPFLKSNTPTLRARIDDPDKTNVGALFDVYRGSTLVWDGGQTAGLPAGSEHYRRTSALPDGTYAWNVFGIDTEGRIGPGVSCEFTVDTVNPNSPTIAAVAIGGEVVAKYAKDEVSALIRR